MHYTSTQIVPSTISLSTYNDIARDMSQKDTWCSDNTQVMRDELKKTVDDNNDAITFHRKKTYSWCWMSIDNLWSQVKIRAISSYRYNKRTQLFLNVLYLVSIHQAVHTNGSSATTSTVWPCTFNIFKVYQQLEVQKRTIKNELKLWPKSGTEFTRNAHFTINSLHYYKLMTMEPQQISLSTSSAKWGQQTAVD